MCYRFQIAEAADVIAGYINTPTTTGKPGKLGEFHFAKFVN